MSKVNIRFVVGELNEEDVQSLLDGQAVISKMILSKEDYRMFHYREGDRIEVQSENGNRQWCTISNLEVIENEVGVIIILSVMKAVEFARSGLRG
jgi:hypothetical protein